jgi:carboxynorspermidine decarboxylase
VTASGLYEARLGHETFAPESAGKEIHTYSPAYSEDELRETLEYSGHIYFNSISQLKRFAPLVRELRSDAVIGLRVNPQISLVKNSELYDPSALGSRFGVHKTELTDEVMALVDLLHFHNLCENLAVDSVKLIQHVGKEFAPFLAKVKYINLGGGHYYTHPDYDRAALVKALRELSAAHDVQITLEPGGAHVYNAGWLVTTVLDIIERGDSRLAILDTSASAHMPDVLEVPYRPPLPGSGEAGEKAHTYTLGGKTCMTGDVIGAYSFDEPLNIGDRLVFADMAQYAMVKNTTFNGMPLPDIGVLEEDGTYRHVKSFGYQNFKNRLS